MNGFNFTERVRKILAMAREEAARLHDEYVGPEHMLLGIVREGQGVGTAVLLKCTGSAPGLHRHPRERGGPAFAGDPLRAESKSLGPA